MFFLQFVTKHTAWYENSPVDHEAETRERLLLERCKVLFSTFLAYSHCCGTILLGSDMMLNLTLIKKEINTTDDNSSRHELSSTEMGHKMEVWSAHAQYA